MTILTNFTEGDSTPKALRLLLHKGKRSRSLWLPVSQLNLFESRIEIKPESEWLLSETILPILNQGWEGITITKVCNVT